MSTSFSVGDFGAYDGLDYKDNETGNPLGLQLGVVVIATSHSLLQCERNGNPITDVTPTRTPVIGSSFVSHCCGVCYVAVATPTADAPAY